MSCVKTERAQCIQDLGVTIVSNLKFSQQCKDATGKANRMLGFINRNLSFKNKDKILPLYIRLVRPHLEYYSLKYTLSSQYLQIIASYN